jgi:hypothetical protein
MSMMRYSASATFLLLLELLLEPDSESDTLPLDAEPALEADDAMLSAWLFSDRANAPAAHINRMIKVIFIYTSLTGQIKQYKGERDACT